MGIDYSIILEKDEEYYDALKANIKLFITKQKILKHREQNEKTVFFLSFYTTEEVFAILENEIKSEFNVCISDFTSITYPHYHITRYRDIVGSDNFEEIHESIAVNLKVGYWEVYYQGGELENFKEKSGSLKDYGIYIFTVTLKEDDDVQTTLETAFDTWMQNNR